MQLGNGNNVADMVTQTVSVAATKPQEHSVSGSVI